MSDSDRPEQEAAAVAELQEEVARLKQQLGDGGTVALPHEPRRTGWWRPVVATVLIVVMAVLAPLAVVARWAHDEIAQTDRYVETITPLAQDPAIQAAVIDRITTEIVTRLQVQDVTDQAVQALTDRGLPPLASSSLQALSTPLADAIEGFVEEQVAALVKSDQFEQAWVEANRQAHTQMVAVLTGKDSDTVTVSNNTVSVNLATVIDTVKQRLVARGFTLAERLPPIQAQFTIFESDDIAKAQTAFRLLSALNTALPIVALLCFAVAVGVARNRRRTVVAGSLAVVLSMLLLGVGLNAFRVVYLDAVPADQLPPDAAAAIYDTLVWFIRLNIRALLVLFLAIAFVAWVTGPVGAPAALRRGTARAIGTVRSGGDRVGINTGSFGRTLGTFRTPIRVGVLGLALVVYVLRAHPTGAFTLWLVIVTAVVLLIVELLSRPPVPLEAASTQTPGAPGPS
jgi:hypothetical protein